MHNGHSALKTELKWNGYNWQELIWLTFSFTRIHSCTFIHGLIWTYVWDIPYLIKSNLQVSSQDTNILLLLYSKAKLSTETPKSSSGLFRKSDKQLRTWSFNNCIFVSLLITDLLHLIVEHCTHSAVLILCLHLPLEVLYIAYKMIRPQKLQPCKTIRAPSDKSGWLNVKTTFH